MKSAILRKRIITDTIARQRIRMIYDFDIKSKIKSGAMSVANGLSWVSEKMKEKVDPAKYASEKEARQAEKQKLKDLSTIKGCLKEIGSLIKSKLGSATGGKLSAVVDKIKSLASKIKEKVVNLKAKHIVAGAGILSVIGLILKLTSNGSR